MIIIILMMPCKLNHDEVKFTGMEVSGGTYGRVFEVEVDSLQSISIFAQGDDDKVLQDSFLNDSVSYLEHTSSPMHCSVNRYGFALVIVLFVTAGMNVHFPNSKVLLIKMNEYF